MKSIKSFFTRIRNVLTALVRCYVSIVLKKGINQGYRLHTYTDRHARFDYSRYREAQQEANKNKLHWTWVVEDNIEFLADYIRRHIAHPRFGICHGTRRGKEQEWFGKYLHCDVIGTEISESATDFPNTVRWDFHDENPAWLNKADFIYSNSFDHTHSPEACLNTWIKSLRVGGYCILEHSDRSGPEYVNKYDPFGADITLMPWLLATWGRESFFLKELVKAPYNNQHTNNIWFFIIERRQ